jgi:hypothetical protein
VTGISPASGPLAGGGIVIVTGSGFTGATEVRFGSAPATILAGASDTQLTVTSPSSTTSGTVDVTVTNSAAFSQVIRIPLRGSYAGRACGAPLTPETLPTLLA